MIDETYETAMSTTAERQAVVGLAGQAPASDWVIVTRGLKPGEKIVAGTYQAIRELKDGALVRQMQEPASTTTATATKKT